MVRMAALDIAYPSKVMGASTRAGSALALQTRQMVERCVMSRPSL